MRWFVPVLSGALVVAASVAADAQQIRPRTLSRDAVASPDRPPAESLSVDRRDPGGPAVGTVVAALSLDEILEVARAAGIEKAEISAAADGQRSVFGYHQGLLVEYSPYSCAEGRCRELSFYGYFGKQDEVDAAFLNAFNRAKVATLFKNNEGELVLRFNLRLEGGVSRDHVSATARYFTEAMRGAISYKPPS